MLLQTLCTAPFTSSKSTGEFLSESLMLPQFSEYGLMSKIGDVLSVVEGRRCTGAFIRLLTMTRLTWKDTWLKVSSGTGEGEKTDRTFEDTEPTKVCKGTLQFFNCSRACHVCLGCPSLSLLLYSSHLLKKSAKRRVPVAPERLENKFASPTNSSTRHSTMRPVQLCCK